jgi:hypothetical protein
LQREVRTVRLVAGLALCVGIATPQPSAPSRVDRDDYVATLSPTAEYRKGAPATFGLELTTRRGLHVNREYPTRFMPAGPPEVHFAAERFDIGKGLTLESCQHGEDACMVRGTIPFRPERTGPATVGGVLAVSLCDQERCLIEKIALALPIVVR